jgi:hypothetical protein
VLGLIGIATGQSARDRHRPGHGNGAARPRQAQAAGDQPAERLYAHARADDAAQVGIRRDDRARNRRAVSDVHRHQPGILLAGDRVASHKVQAIDELWLDNEKAWSGPAACSRALRRLSDGHDRLEGTSANGVAIDSVWTASSTLTGCAYTRLKFKLTGNSSSSRARSPAASPAAITIRGKGAFVYDPRLDSTVAGGSGTHARPTIRHWAWDDNGSRNPALQLLFYLLGWKINGKLALGMGLPPARIDLPSFITAANICDESITLNGGGTEPRYRLRRRARRGRRPPGGDREFVRADERDAARCRRQAVADVLSQRPRGAGRIVHRGDILEGGNGRRRRRCQQSFNIVRGRRIDPSDNALYQPVDFPEVSLASNDGIDRIDTVEYTLVQSNGQAQRLAKQRLQRNQYQGRYTFTGGERWWQVSIGEVVQFSATSLMAGRTSCSASSSRDRPERPVQGDAARGKRGDLRVGQQRGRAAVTAGCADDLRSAQRAAHRWPCRRRKCGCGRRRCSADDR